ncbi:hypothetical protein PYCC9005_001201 [Savitreella phatthalungensis]
MSDRSKRKQSKLQFSPAKQPSQPPGGLQNDASVSSSRMRQGTITNLLSSSPSSSPARGSQTAVTPVKRSVSTRGRHETDEDSPRPVMFKRVAEDAGNDVQPTDISTAGKGKDLSKSVLVISDAEGEEDMPRKVSLQRASSPEARPQSFSRTHQTRLPSSKTTKRKKAPKQTSKTKSERDHQKSQSRIDFGDLPLRRGASPPHYDSEDEEFRATQLGRARRLPETDGESDDSNDLEAAGAQAATTRDRADDDNDHDDADEDDDDDEDMIMKPSIRRRRLMPSKKCSDDEAEIEAQSSKRQELADEIRDLRSPGSRRTRTKKSPERRLGQRATGKEDFRSNLERLRRRKAGIVDEVDDADGEEDGDQVEMWDYVSEEDDKEDEFEHHFSNPPQEKHKARRKNVVKKRPAKLDDDDGFVVNSSEEEPEVDDAGPRTLDDVFGDPISGRNRERDSRQHHELYDRELETFRQRRTPQEQFKICVQYEVLDLVYPQNGVEPEPYFKSAIDWLIDRTTGKGELAKSSVWILPFTAALRRFPDMEAEEIPRPERDPDNDICEACNRGNRPTTWIVRFAGTRYDRLTLEDFDDDMFSSDQDGYLENESEESDSDAHSHRSDDARPRAKRQLDPSAIPTKAGALSRADRLGRDKPWRLGQNCYERAQISHELVHLRKELRREVEERLHRDGVIAKAAKLNRRDGRARVRLANDVTDALDADKFTFRLWQRYRHAIERGEQYIVDGKFR